MKKLLFEAWAVLAVSSVLVSCTNDKLAEVTALEKKEVTLTTSLDVASRAVVSGEEMELFYTVYHADDGTVAARNTAGLDAVSFGGDISVTLTLQLEKNQSYDIAFWAQPKGLTCYDLTDMKAIKLNYEDCCGNDAARNAFYGSVFGLKVVGDDTSASAVLKSPFAKLEVLTTTEDVEAAATIGYEVDRMKSSMKVSGVADTFNALYGTAEGSGVTADLLPGTVPEDVRNIEGQDYRVLTADYMLGFRKQAVDVEVKLMYTDIERQPLVFTAGKAWLERGGVSTLTGRFLTYPIELEASVNGWKDSDGEIEI